MRVKQLRFKVDQQWMRISVREARKWVVNHLNPISPTDRTRDRRQDPTEAESVPVEVLTIVQLCHTSLVSGHHILRIYTILAS